MATLEAKFQHTETYARERLCQLKEAEGDRSTYLAGYLRADHKADAFFIELGDTERELDAAQTELDAKDSKIAHLIEQVSTLQRQTSRH